MSGGTADFFYREAQRLGYVARSAFKLLQLQKQFKLIAGGASVLDLGCAPGAWLQVACQSLGPLEKGGAVVGVDLKVIIIIFSFPFPKLAFYCFYGGMLGAEQKVKVPSHHCDSRVRTVCADVMDLMKSQARELSPQGKGFSVVLSDMCPVVSGITTKDSAISCELGKRALSLAVGASLPVSGNKIDEEFLDSSEPDSNEDGVLRRGGNVVIKLLESEEMQGFGNFCKPRFKKVSWSRPKATRSSSREIYLICQGLR